MEIDEEKGETVANEAQSTEVRACEPFKKPQLCLVGPRKGKGVQARPVIRDGDPKNDDKTNASVSNEPSETESTKDKDPDRSNIVESKSEEVRKPSHIAASEDSNPVKKQKAPSLSPAQELAQNQKQKETPLPYREPKWSGIPPAEYSLDIVKSGVALDPIDVSNKSFYVFGRQTNCDIQMAHPTVSRYHAVLQYSEGTDDRPPGFYVFDMGSTHGTFVNKNRIRPEMYVRVHVGHQIKIGCSSRIYLLQGPGDDMENESELTVSELKAQRQKELQERALAELEKKRKEEEEAERRENEGVSWGMDDDADEETDLTENPYAATTNEDLYIDDPKKTLRGWFEREGHELEYEVEEKGPGQFLCRVEVPVEGSRGGCMTAEALVKGKKKEAVAQCALEACRLLDRLGLLRQASHESRKRKTKNWEEEDFYDSDDDNFLDRTGVVEKKRERRMQQAGKVEKQVETYESLSKKHADVLTQLHDMELQLEKATAVLAAAKKKSAEDDDDSLDSFMNNLASIGCTDKKLVSKLKVDLASLQKEEAQLRKLVNIARPASLPELIPPASASQDTSSKDLNALKNKLVLAARKKAVTKQKTLVTKASNVDPSRVAFDSNEDEIKEESEDTNENNAQDTPKSADYVSEKQKQCKVAGPAKPTSQTEDLNVAPDESTSHQPSKQKEKKIFGPAKPTCVAEVETSSGKTLSEDANNEAEEDGDSDEDDPRLKEKRKRRNRRRLMQRIDKAVQRTKTDYDASDPNYSVWVPPEDQSGDGKTKLNEKLGY